MTDRTFYMYAPTVTVTGRKPARHRRKPTLTSALKQAGKAGVNVAGATIEPDGSVSLAFSNRVDMDADNTLDNWIAKHHAH